MTPESIKILKNKLGNGRLEAHDAYDLLDYMSDLESQLKEKDVIISEYHTKMLADKESYFKVVEAHEELESDNEYIKKQNIDVHNEIKPLIKALRKIESLTGDEQLPLLKALREIARKALK